MAQAEKQTLSSLKHVGIVTKYAFLNYFRARRFYVMLAIVVIIGVSLTLVIGYYQPLEVLLDPLSFYGTVYGRFASFIVILSAAFFGGDAISGEFQGRTGYFLVPNPIRRSAIYTGKWIAALVASSIILSLYAIIALANGVYYFGIGASFPNVFLQSIAFSWIYLISAMSLIFAFSSLFKSSSVSILMSVILLLFVFDTFNVIASVLAGLEPWFSITYGAGIISNVLTVPYPPHETTFSAGPRFKLTSFNATIPEGVAILGIYFVVMAFVGLWLFEKKEFTS